MNEVHTGHGEPVGDAPAPWGAPEATVNPGQAGGYFESGRPRLGGLEQPHRFTDGQAAVLDAAADTMIPPAAGWPAPSEVDIVTFAGRYISPAGYQAKHFPWADADSFAAGLDRLGQQFVDGSVADRTAAIEELEKNEDALFDQLRALVYYGYYSRPEVVIAIRKNVPAGKDYHGPPLPYGYIATLEDWDEETLAQASEKGSYLATDEVERVDLSQLSWTK